MPLPPKPSFRETPSKTTIFVMEFREKTGVLRSAEPFSEGEKKVVYNLFLDPKKATDK